MVDDLDDATDDLKGYRSLFHGPAPEIAFKKTSKAEIEALVEWIESCKDEHIEESDICVLARTKDGRDEVADALKERGYDVVVLQPSKADDRRKVGVRVSTMHRAKGLEFAAVALAHVNEDVVPPKWLLQHAADPAIRRSIVDGEKSLIHVSATRAKKRLFVSCAGSPSELIKHLDPDRTGDGEIGVSSQPVVFVGFDSAWADNAKAPGAICSVLFDGSVFTDFQPLGLVGFDRALDYIRSTQRPGAPMIVALDQPTIVPNATGMRPSEKVVGSLISWTGGGVQPANTGRPLFGRAAPVTRFLRHLGAVEDPEMARTADHGVHLMEVFPALALASLEPAFFGLRKGPRYNPARRKTFRIEDWRAVVDAVMREAVNLGCTPLVSWIEETRANAAPLKEHQDRLDSVLCLLIAIRWRLGKREQSVAVGDLKNGYIVAPVSEPVLKRLRDVAAKRGVPIDDLGEPVACVPAIRTLEPK